MNHSVGLKLNLEMSRLWNDVSISTMIPDVLIDDVNITSAILRGALSGVNNCGFLSQQVVEVDIIANHIYQIIAPSLL